MRIAQQARSAAGRLNARPKTPAQAGSVGMHPLNLDDDRDGLIDVPITYHSDHPAPLIVMLHGAGGNAEGALNIVRRLADSFGVIVLAVDSRYQTWDAIRTRFGPDIDFIDRALALTFDRYVIDPNHVAIAGFSDGASYALSVGITNGDLFTHILAFSPGFINPADQVGMPQILISHGVSDAVLPIDRCSRKIVPRLQGAGYSVQYHEFAGAHIVPQEIVDQAFNWFV